MSAFDSEEELRRKHDEAQKARYGNGLNPTKMPEATAAPKIATSPATATPKTANAPSGVSSPSTSISQPKKHNYANGVLDLLQQNRAAQSRAQVSDDFDEQETAQRLKRERRNRIIAGVGDTISAIANMWGTAKHAENVKMPLLSDRYKERYEKIKAEREARKGAYMKASAAYKKNEGDLYQTYINARMKEDAARLADAKAEREAASARVYQNRQLAAAEKDLGLRELYLKKAEIEEELAAGKIGKQKAEIKLKNAQAKFNNERSRGGSRSSGGRGTKYSFTDYDGVVHTYENKPMYEQGVDYYYRGDAKGSTNTTDKTDGYGMRSSSTTQKAPTTSQKAAQMKRNADAKKASKKKYSATAALGLTNK